MARSQQPENLETTLLTPLERGNSRRALSSKGESNSSFSSSLARQLSALAGFKNDSDELREKAIGSMLFSVDTLGELMEEKNASALEDFGGVAGLARGLGTSLKRGLTGSDDVQRIAKYGANKLERKSPPTYWELFLEAMQDTTVIILLIAAVVSISLSVLVCVADLGGSCPRKPLWAGPVDLTDMVDEEGDECLSWLDGSAIIMACLLIGNITAWNETNKEAQFRNLQSKQDDCDVTVMRNGVEARVDASSLMVGDLAMMSTGDRIPADGIYVSGNDLRVDESSLTGESDTVKKNENSPYLSSGTTVTDGDCVFLITAVGIHSEWGKILQELSSERDETPLQEKLTVLAEDIGKAGTAVATACFIAQTIIWFIDMSRPTCFEAVAGKATSTEDCVLGYPGFDDKDKCLAHPPAGSRLWMSTYDNFHWMKLQDLVGFFIDSVTIIVVAVPEGLPLAVTLALAFSVKKMQTDQNLVRVMAACETMGGCTNICSDKTGTLTQNVMSVTDGYFAGRNSEGQLPQQSEYSEKVYKLLCDAIANNCKASMGVDGKTGRPVVIGSKTEGALLVFLRGIGCDYRAVKQSSTLVKSYPFSSLKKRMSTVSQNSQGKLQLYTKGASEIVLQLCSRYTTEDGESKPLTEELRKRIMQSITKMASQGLRTICIAYRDVAADEELPDSDEGAEGIETDLTCIAITGIKDPVRKEVPAAVRSCQHAGITVRMVTGDNILTAKNIAKECGILTPNGTAIEGPEFRKMSPEAQKDLLRNLQVMARCSPQDKLTLVQRLKEMSEVVAVTGDGTNDAPALKEADVGLSMGISGTSVAQEASDIVIMDDNFSSIVKSVMWGRSVYDNIRRFLQFQLTVNVVALAICFVGAVTGFGTPLKPVQLLWVNLIMDTFGALALATEPPTPDLLDRQPYGRNDSLVNASMWRNITVQSIYQLAVQLTLLWVGVDFLTDCTGGSCVPLKPNGEGHDPAGNYRDTFIYNSFVWSQLFNQLNCRRIYNELNMLSGVFDNPIFCGIWFTCAIVQVLNVQYGGQVFRTVPLDYYDWGACIGIGSFSLLLGVFQRFLPSSLFSARAPTTSWQTTSNHNDRL